MADERIDSMGVPITGSQRDENVDALERRVRNQFEACSRRRRIYKI